MSSRPRLLLTELREYRSERGSTYFAGYLGKTRVVMLRDERAELTGREVARWNVLLEEPQPREQPVREAPADRAGEAQDGRSVRQGAEGRETAQRRPSGPPRRSPGPSDRERQERTAAEKRAGQALRDRGIDPRSDIRQDDIGF